MTDVFFSGYGYWYEDIYLHRYDEYGNEVDAPDLEENQITTNQKVRGVFSLSSHDEVAYKHTKNFDDVTYLKPSNHQDRHLWGFHTSAYRINAIDMEKYFHIDASKPRTLVIAQPDNPTKTKTIGDDGTGSHAGTEPTILNQASNDTEFSGLLNTPNKTDDWFNVIDDMTKAFFNEHRKIPNDTQAWGQLSAVPLAGYVITTGTDKGEECLFMPGAKPLGKSAFSKRWANYNADKT